MSDMTERQQTALEAIANRFGTPRENGIAPTGANSIVAGKRLDAGITFVEHTWPDPGGDAKPRLRFDKVAGRLVEHLQANLSSFVPTDMSAVLTITAPILLPSKTAVALEYKVRALLDHGGAVQDQEDTIHGNHIRVRLLGNVSERVPRVIGFVHNPDSDPLLLLNLATQLLDLAGEGASYSAPTADGDRWLVATSDATSSSFGAYRTIYSHLGMATEFGKILMVFDDGFVGLLAG